MILYISSAFESFPSCIPLEQRQKKRNVWEYYDLKDLSILQSYAYAKPLFAEHYKECKNFLMDSGAFTLMMHQSSTKNFDIKKFAKEYATFIKKYDIDNFIELDVDGLFGIDVYKDILHMVQDITGKDPLRVFHGWRGKDYYLELVKKKKSICLGGVAVGVNRNNTADYFQWFLDRAHENGCKVHGLAITSPDFVRRFDFDSVDSSSWTFGARGACVYRFDGTGMQMYKGSENCPPGKRVDTVWVMRHNFDEWIKFQHMAEQIDTLYEKTIE